MIAKAAWEARAGYDVGRMIERYLADNPPPDGSQLADDLAASGRLLRSAGENALDAYGMATLRSVE